MRAHGANDSFDTLVECSAQLRTSPQHQRAGMRIPCSESGNVHFRCSGVQHIAIEQNACKAQCEDN